MSPRGVPHAPRAPRGHAETAQRGVFSWRSENGQLPAGRLPVFLRSAGLPPVDARAQATDGMSDLRNALPVAASRKG